MSDEEGGDCEAKACAFDRWGRDRRGHLSSPLNAPVLVTVAGLTYARLWLNYCEALGIIGPDSIQRQLLDLEVSDE